MKSEICGCESRIVWIKGVGMAQSLFPCALHLAMSARDQEDWVLLLWESAS